MFRSLTIALISVLLVSCSRPPDLVGIDNQARPVATVAQAQKHKIFIATTRESSEVVGAFFSGSRAPELGFASVVVSIPPNHVPGEIERPAELPPDPRTEFAIIEPTVYGVEGSFVSSLNQALAQLPPGDRDILLFVHGYNNTISDSILLMAQFVEDTDFSGVPVLFSWASAARPSHYVYDLNSALIARPRLLATARVLGKTNAKSFNLLAHSMGAMLTMEAIVQSDISGTYNQSGRLKNVLFAAPDIDLDLFRAQVGQLTQKDHGYFVLVSEDDKALGFSKLISGGITRVGAADANELQGLGVTVLDVSQIDDSNLGTHSKFAGSPEIVKLIGEAMNAGQLAQSSPTSLGDMLAGIPITLIRSD